MNRTPVQEAAAMTDKCIIKNFQIEAGLKAIAQCSRDGFSNCESVSSPEMQPYDISSLAELLVVQVEEMRGLLSSIDFYFDKEIKLEGKQ